MTTTQTGGGNGAAPDGGAGRTVPDKSGWWWRMWDYSPYVEEVDECDLSVMCIDGDDVVDDGTWIAPIPSPAVCAALSRYAGALDDLDALWDGADFITRNNVTNRAHDAGDALDAAIRTERGGGA